MYRFPRQSIDHLYPEGLFLGKMAKDNNIVPCFNSFYEFMRDDYRQEMALRPIPIYKQDFDIDNFLTTLRQYYHGGRFDFLLNSKENIDLLNKRFVVFEVDSIKENKELFPIVTIIIMEAFINKMRRLKGIRKMIIVEEAWKALSTANMAEYLKYMFKTDIDTEYLAFLLVGQTEQFLNLVEAVHILALVEQDFTV